MRKKVIVFGGSGLIGQHLIPKLLIQGFEVVNCDIQKLDIKDINYTFKNYNSFKHKINPDLLEGSKAIINLIGYPINKRWTLKNMELIYKSRVESNQKITQTIQDLDKKPHVLISASGISVYNPNSKQNTEDSKVDDRFIAKLVQDWEKPILESSATRNICFRQGYVFAKDGGLFEKIIQPYKFLISVQFFKPNQYLPFIHIDDLTDIYLEAIQNQDYQGVINAVSPDKLKTDEIYKLIEKIKHPFFHIKIPKLILNLVFKDFANEITTSIDVQPEKLNTLKFKFKYSHPSTCILNLLDKS